MRRIIRTGHGVSSTMAIVSRVRHIGPTPCDPKQVSLLGRRAVLYSDIDGTKPHKFMWLGDIDGIKPYKFIWFGDIDGSKPYKYIWFGNIDGVIRDLGPISARPHLVGRRRPAEPPYRPIGCLTAADLSGDFGSCSRVDFRSISPEGLYVLFLRLGPEIVYFQGQKRRWASGIL